MWLRPPASTLLVVAALVTGALAALDPAVAAAQEGARRDEKPAPPPPPQPTLTKPPELLEGAEPVYPAEAAAKGLTAAVVVRISVDATGQVSKVDVVTQVGNGFDEAAAEAAMKYRFSPAEFDGKPGPIVIETTIHFQMVEQEIDVPVEDDRPKPPAGTAIISGVVKERGTRRKLAGVVVSLAELQRDVFTDAAGAFSFDAVPAGTYKVLAVLPGYDRFSETLTVGDGEAVDTTLYLRAKGGTPYETVVEGEREKLEVTRRSLSRRELTTVPGTFGDPIRVLLSLPGMARAPFIAGLLLIRGSNPDDSGVYVDGVRVPLLYHFLGGPSILNPQFLDDIDLYPGGYPARFGNSIGGVIDVNTRPTASDGIHGAADIDFLDTSVYLRAPLGKRVTLAVAGRRSYVDALLPFVLPEPDPGETLVVVPVYWDYQARLDVALPRGDKLNLLAFGSDDRLDVLATEADDEQTFDLGTHIGFHRLRAAFTTRLAPGWSFTLTPMAGRDVVSFAAGERSSTEITDSFVGVREQLIGKIGKRLRIDTGIDLTYRLTSYELNIPVADDVIGFTGNPGGIEVPPSRFTRTADGYTLGLYAEAAWDLGPVRLIPGLRTDLQILSGEERVSLDPRFVARWQVRPKTVLKGHVGLFHQPPQPEGLDSRYGNPKLGLERAIHTGIGVEQKFLRHIETSVEAYYIDRSNLAVFSQEIQVRDDGTLDPLYWESEATGRTWGLELLVKHDVTRNFYGWLSYTLSRSTQKRHPDDPERPTLFDQTHNLIAAASYRTDGGWELGARLQLTTGRPYTPFLGATFDADAGAYAPLTGESRSARLPIFNQLDVRLDKTWVFKTWLIGAYIDVINVLDWDNSEATQWDYRYRDSAPVRGMPFLPTLGVKGEW